MKRPERTIEIDGAQGDFCQRKGIKFEIGPLDTLALSIVEQEHKAEFPLAHAVLFDEGIKGRNDLDVFMSIPKSLIRVRGERIQAPLEKFLGDGNNHFIGVEIDLGSLFLRAFDEDRRASEIFIPVDVGIGGLEHFIAVELSQIYAADPECKGIFVPCAVLDLLNTCLECCFCL